jgi:hypothetical protein
VLVQLQPNGVTLASIAAGHSDDYLRSYADAVIAFGHPVILSFGHEMNGSWYSWGYGRASPATFVAAWRHIVRLFRGGRRAVPAEGDGGEHRHRERRRGAGRPALAPAHQALAAACAPVLGVVHLPVRGPPGVRA